MSTLIRLVLLGDKQATVNFYKKYAPSITRYLVRKLPDFEDAKDLTHDVFLEALDSLPLLKDHEKVLSWLYTIAHHKAADFYRRRKIKAIFLSTIPFLQIVDKEIHEPEFIYEKNVVRDRIEKTLLSLPKRQSLILRLHYEKDIPVKGIALQLNLSFKATESLLFRARKNFKITYERTTIY